MKHIITTDKDTSYTFDQVIENEIYCGAKWAELGCFECDEFENGHYYYFSNYDFSEGAYYNEETDELITAGELDDMEIEEAEEIQFNWEFVNEPIDREVLGIHAEYRSKTCRLYVIKDEDSHDYGDGSGIYQYFDGLFYQVGIESVEG